MAFKFNNQKLSELKGNAPTNAEKTLSVVEGLLSYSIECRLSCGCGIVGDKRIEW